jgi:GNAT superfamily N-acetyltransferase
MMDVVPIQPRDYVRAAEVLTKAFFNDPVTCYVQPDAARRARGLPWLHERYVAVIAAMGTAFMTTNCEGVALWIPPANRGHIPLWPLIRSGLWQVPFRIGLSRLPHLLRAQEDSEKRRRDEVTEPHWVLDVLGVHPDHQGKGVGGALVRQMIARADAEGIPCHVITHNDKNVAIYERLGFQLLQGKCVLPGGPVTYSLRRPTGG